MGCEMSANGPLPYAVADVIEHIGRRLQSLAYSENLNPAQWTLLRFLARSNPSARTPTGFARFHLTTKSAATQTIEALLRKHGPRIIGRVERCARRDPNFARLLAHVWQSALPKTIWARVQHVRERHQARDDAGGPYLARPAASY